MIQPAADLRKPIKSSNMRIYPVVRHPRTVSMERSVTDGESTHLGLVPAYLRRKPDDEAKLRIRARVTRRLRRGSPISKELRLAVHLDTERRTRFQGAWPTVRVSWEATDSSSREQVVLQGSGLKEGTTSAGHSIMHACMVLRGSNQVAGHRTP